MLDISARLSQGTLLVMMLLRETNFAGRVRRIRAHNGATPGGATAISDMVLFASVGGNNVCQTNMRASLWQANSASPGCRHHLCCCARWHRRFNFFFWNKNWYSRWRERRCW